MLLIYGYWGVFVKFFENLLVGFVYVISYYIDGLEFDVYFI